MIKVALIGTGKIAATHLSAISNTDECEICALCDINEAAVSELAKEYGVPYFTDYRDIPDHTDADAVIINLPHNLHCESTVFFLEHGLNVLVEKPMANTVEECDRMIAAAKQSGKKLAVGHTMRYLKVYPWLREAIREERYGKLCMITGFRGEDYFMDNRPRWFLDKEKAGGGIGMNLGAHALDSIFYVLGESDPEITAGFGNIKNSYNVEGHMQFMLKFPSGVSMCQTLCGYMNCGHEVTFYFTDGALRLDGGILLEQMVGGKWEPIDLQEDWKYMARELADFCRFLRDEPNMVCDGPQGRAVIAALNQVYAS